MGKTSNFHIANIDKALKDIDDGIAGHNAKRIEWKALDPKFDHALQAKDNATYTSLVAAENALFKSMNKDLDAIAAARRFALAELAVFDNYLKEKDSATKMPWNKKSLGSSKKFVTAAKARVNGVNISTWRYPAQ